jgi:hypothetical protein
MDKVLSAGKGLEEPRMTRKGSRSPSLIIARLSGEELQMMRKVLCMAVALAFYFIPSAQAGTDFTLDLTTQNGTPASGAVTGWWKQGANLYSWTRIRERIHL